MRKEHSVRAHQRDQIKNQVMASKLNRSLIQDLVSQKKGELDRGFDRIFPKVKELHATMSTEQKKKLIELIVKFHKKHKRYR